MYLHNDETEDIALRLRDEETSKRSTEFYNAMNKLMLRICR